MPGARPNHVVQQNKDGSVTLVYQPTEQGVHELNLSHNDKPTEGTPFRCHVDAVKGGYVTAFGQGLAFGKSGETAAFTVVGGGKLDISLDGPSKAEIQKKEEKDGATHVEFLPYSPGEYNIHIKVGGRHIHGSPFSSKISGEGHKRSQLVLSGSSDYTLGGDNVDLAGLVGTIKTPGGAVEPCLLKKTSDGALGLASWAPKSKGIYHVEVTKDGGKHPGSPWSIEIQDKQVSNASKVKMHGALKEAMSAKWNVIELDIVDAGHGSLALSIEGPHRCDFEAVEKSRTKNKVQYRPHEPGLYLLNIRFADDHIPGSPFMVGVGGDPSGRMRNTMVKEIAAVAPINKGAKCEFQLKIPGTDPLEMEAALTSPSGKTELCEIRDEAHNMYDIHFVPSEEGVHTVSLKYRGLHISGSPFQYTVGSCPSAGAYKVEIGGPGLERGEVTKKCEFNIYTREAGAGQLTVAIEGPSKAEMEVVDRGHGFTTVSYIVSAQGEYGIHVKYNDEHVPDSPNLLYICPHSEGANLVTVHGLRDRGLEPGKPVTFQVNKNGGKGELKAHLDTPSSQEEDIFMQEMDKDLYAVRFIPKENGIYYINIKLDEAHIGESPFPMLIGKMGADPALVLAKGEGLDKGVSGAMSKFFVNTANSGNGTLIVNISGPSKVAIQCLEMDEGYEFSYTPMAPGDYLILIKYCNVTIAGCPTKAVITAGPGFTAPKGSGKASDIVEKSSLAVETVEKKPGSVVKKRFSGDASKVKAKGNGLKKAFLNRMANFTIDVAGAGNALLIAGIITATGNPIEEFNLKKTRGTVYQINYKTKEKGEHSLHVRWGSDDIPGSPFTIGVA